MRKTLGSRLPEFTKEEKYTLIRSFDFLGLNYYGAVYAIPNPSVYNATCPKYFQDYNVTLNSMLFFFPLYYLFHKKSYKLRYIIVYELLTC